MIQSILLLGIVLFIGLFMLKVFHDVLLMGLFFLSVFLAFYMGKRRLNP